MDTQRYLKNVASLEYDASKCTGCRLCLEVCPHNVFGMEAGIAVVVSADSCMECGACEINCRYGALKVKQGVGCATAVISSFFKRAEPACGCSDDQACC